MVMFATSEPALFVRLVTVRQLIERKKTYSGSVMAMQVLLRPSRKSGRNLSCSCEFA